MKGQKEVVEGLIEVGADLNLADVVGKTALHWAGTGDRKLEEFSLNQIFSIF